MRWEYLIVQYVAAPKEQRGKLVWTQQYNIGQPSGEPQTRPADRVDLSSLLNELGRQGWELVAETVLETKPFDTPKHPGPTYVPTELRWTFKRPMKP